ncbi:MAG: hypothetical protein NZ898_01685 [Myxococcota bacterium]|nr:hypothetical protein [Myxococcota bacterium]MDW8362725.1 hypothetical protein [Myxococcales bacterium]
MSLLDIVYEYQMLRARGDLSGPPLDESERARLRGLTSLLRGESLDGAAPPSAEGPLPVQFTVPGGFGSGQVRALGADGLIVESARTLSPGTRTVLRATDVRLGQEYVFPCRVVWTNGPAMGMAFDGLPARAPHRGGGPTSWRPVPRFGARRTVPQYA